VEGRLQAQTRFSYDEMLELASSGSKVMAVALGGVRQEYDVIFEVRSSLTIIRGTIVKRRRLPTMEGRSSCAAVAVRQGPGQGRCQQHPGQAGVRPPVCSAPSPMPTSSSTLIVQNIGHHGIANLTFTDCLRAISHRAHKGALAHRVFR